MKLYNDLGFCAVVGSSGSDRSIVRAARISYGQVEENRSEEQDKKLLTYLFTNRHTSPFEQASMTFNIRMPIFVMRQFVRHRTFKLNEFSARYKKLPDDFYVPNPEDWRKQSQKNKQGSSEECCTPEEGIQLSNRAIELCVGAYRLYEDFVSSGVSNELARIVLPVNIMTEIVVQCDLHNLMHFLYLRTDLHAQQEIRALANAMKEETKLRFPWTMELFEKYKPKLVERE